MSIASRIIVAREDLSIPGVDDAKVRSADDGSAVRDRFLDFLRESKPDVIVFNLTVTEGNGVEAIRMVREHSGVSILVVCASGDPLKSTYCSAGAAECLHPPVDITVLNRSIQNIIRPTHSHSPILRPQPAEYRFPGITYRPDTKSLRGTSGFLLQLTTAESDVLEYLRCRSWSVCSRADIAEFIYSDCSLARQRAVGVVVSQLRKKLVAAGGAGAAHFIKTQLRQGYTLAVDVETVPLDAAAT